MAAIDNYIFGDSRLHERFRAMTQVLSALVACAPRSLSVEQLQNKTYLVPRELAILCEALKQSNLLREDANLPGNWSLACNPSEVTLEEVFYCSMISPGTDAAAKFVRHGVQDQLLQDVDILIMQATMAVNQNICKQLRQFSLDRLRISNAAKPPVCKQALRPYNNSYDNMYDFEVNAWLIDTAFDGKKNR